MTQPRWLRNVRPYGAPAEDLLIENGLFTQRRPASTAPWPPPTSTAKTSCSPPPWWKATSTSTKPSGANPGARTAPARRSRTTSPTSAASCVKSTAPIAATRRRPAGKLHRPRLADHALPRRHRPGIRPAPCRSHAATARTLPRPDRPATGGVPANRPDQPPRHRRTDARSHGPGRGERRWPRPVRHRQRPDRATRFRVQTGQRIRPWRRHSPARQR